MYVQLTIFGRRNKRFGGPQKNLNVICNLISTNLRRVCVVNPKRTNVTKQAGTIVAIKAFGTRA